MRFPPTISIAASWVVPAVLQARQSTCPVPCSTDPRHWTAYTSLDSLDTCDHPVLLDFSSHDSLDSANATFRITACTIDDQPDAPFKPKSLPRNLQDHPNLSGLLQLDFLFRYVQTFLTRSPTHNTRNLLARFNTSSVGLYRGAATDDAFMISVVQGLRDWTTGNTANKSATVQSCTGDHHGDHTFGMAFDAAGGMDTVKLALDAWNKAQCVDGPEVLKFEDIPVIARSLHKRSGHEIIHVTHEYSPEFGCVVETIVYGDTCGTLAERCRLSPAEFMAYNPGNDLCSWLQPGQQVCCTSTEWAGSQPVMNDDGSCASYTTEENDTCASIAAANHLGELDISYYNDGRTWGWTGCDLIGPRLSICLSEGYPPMPIPIDGAVCGPIKPGTEMPTDGTPLAELNPCQLNACCNTLGQCGVSPEYCIYEEGPTGNPGTAPEGRKGCISNCGLDIIDNSEPPAEFMRIGYYESFNFDRPCLNLRAKHINVNDYSHIHWGFVTVNTTFHIGINDTYNQWKDFLALEGVQKVISIGGWGYSVNSASIDVLREAMDPANVDTFIVNIMTFVEENHIDGLDFDWEYPGATDLPSLSLGWLSDGANYLAFLKKLKMIFPRDKTIAIAAPACYFYLRVFPLAEMWPYLDYIVYMTYDLHGQWDYGNPLLQDWCELGNCLRSHVTKAGVPRNKVAVGVASYGRAFGMSEPGCTAPECTFAGPESTALPGPCTGVVGIISNAEIEDIIIEEDINASYYDPGSDSNILVYNDTQWVAYMSKGTLRRRIQYYKDLKFYGFANWAVDLTHWSGDDGDPEGLRDTGLGRKGRHSIDLVLVLVTLK
ncbi:glycoside hydrolase superfamily [Aspergillus pseudoustus]|uniref:chitinase n=1 Tax=Aspergillus pseudoustus TaxID=1810923 RepID=A0ABR4JV70_9EURO